MPDPSQVRWRKVQDFVVSDNIYFGNILARIFYGILLVLVCCVGIIRLLNASNHMQRQREKQSHLELFLKPEGESLIYYRGTDEDSNAWTSKLDEFLARKLKLFSKLKQDYIPLLSLQISASKSPKVRLQQPSSTWKSLRGGLRGAWSLLAEQQLW